jgi:outer membrane receptor protein involved in Fe transport
LRMVPWDGGFLSIDAGYLQNEFSEYSYIDPEDPNNVIDNSNQGVADLSPEWTLNIGLEHEFALSGGATLTPRISVYAQDDYEWLAADRTQDAPPSFCNQDSYAKWNTRLTFVPAQGNWQAAIFGNNVTDEEIYEMCNATRTIYVYRHERPSWWGAEFTMRFGDN